MGIQLPCLPADGEGLGKRGWLQYARVLEKRAQELRSKLHGDLRQRMKKQRAGRGVRLTRMTEPTSEDGGGREGAALSNAQRKKRDGAVDSAVIREEAGETGSTEGSNEWGRSKDKHIGIPEAVDGLGQVLLVPQPR